MSRMSALVVLLLACMQASGARTEPGALEAPADSVAPDVKGSYIWVPDSLRGAVDHFLRSRRPVDVHERTVFRGDTIPMVLKDRNLGRFDRGLFNYLYLPKGLWNIGLTASYGDFSTSDLSMFEILSDVDISVSAFSVRPYFTYTVRNNLAVGMRLGYTNMKGNIDRLDMDFDDDMNFSLHDIKYRNESYAASLLLSQYVGVMRRGRFGVFNEVALTFSSGSSDFHRPYNGEIKRTRTTYMDARLTYSPGVSVFVMKNVSCNVSFGVFGFYLHNEKQTTDGVPSGNRFTSGANFKFNIFNIAFGMAVHI